MGIERRFSNYKRASVEDSSGEGSESPGVLTDYAVQWGALSQPLWRDSDTGKPILERFQAGAFTGKLEDVVGLRDHDRSRLLGRVSSETMTVTEDETGLLYSIELPDTTDGRDVSVLARRGDLNGSSFSFTIAKDGEEWEETDNEIIRTVTAVGMTGDVGPVTSPAYLDGAMSIRSVQDSFQEWRTVTSTENHEEPEAIPAEEPEQTEEEPSAGIPLKTRWKAAFGLPTLEGE